MLSTTGEIHHKCPVEFSKKEVLECLSLAVATEAVDSQFQDCLEIIGVGSEGWVPAEQYDNARQREHRLREDTLAEAESEEERSQIRDHWIFDDFDETVYL